MTVLTSALESKMPPYCSPCAPANQKHTTIWSYFKKAFKAQVFSPKPNRKAAKIAKEPTTPTLRRESFFLSTTSLEKRRPSEQSVDTVITLVEELDNIINEELEDL